MNYLENLKPFLLDIAKRTKEALGENFIGFYVAGSLTMGSWNPETSDVDFLVVIKDKVNKNQIESLEKINKELSNNSIYRKLEGEYIPLYDLQKKNFSITAPALENGQFNSSTPCMLSSDNILCFNETGVTILGTNFRELDLVVSVEEFKDSVYGMLLESKSKIYSSDTLSEKVKILINIMRCIYSLETSKLPTKKGSLEFSRKLLNEDTYKSIIKYLDTKEEFNLPKEVLLQLYKHALNYKN